jgi:hypothetical protein
MSFGDRCCHAVDVVLKASIDRQSADNITAVLIVFPAFKNKLCGAVGSHVDLPPSQNSMRPKYDDQLDGVRDEEERRRMGYPPHGL